jgi:rubrerythrin
MYSYISSKKITKLIFAVVISTIAALASPTALITETHAEKRKPLGGIVPSGGSSGYPLTIEALKAAHYDEIQSYNAYSKYSQRALEDSLPNVAYLFKAFSESEFINARNCYNLLYDLKEHSHLDIKPVIVGSTKENLTLAIQMELKEIEERYPQLINKIMNERHYNAISCLNHTLNARVQHRNLLKKMQGGTGIFWRVMSDKIERTELLFFLCQICGSIQNEIPERTCPICENPAYFYKEVKRPGPPSKPLAKTHPYVKTIEVLKTMHRDEIKSYHVYMKYSEKALEENFPNAAYLFKTFADGEFINARNFYNLLVDLEEDIRVAIGAIDVSSTRDNIAKAVLSELEEIEDHYPRSLERISTETHYNAIAFTQHAFESRKQHLSLLLEVQEKKSPLWNIIFAAKERMELQFFICQICGSILNKIPDTTCPICENPAYFYRNIDKPKSQKP